MHGLGVEMVAAAIAVLVVPRTLIVASAQRQAGPAQDSIVAYVKPDKVHRGLAPTPLAIRRLAIQPAEQPKAGARIARWIAGKHVDYPAQSPVPYRAEPAPLTTSTRSTCCRGTASHLMSPTSDDSIGNPSTSISSLLPVPRL